MDYIFKPMSYVLVIMLGYLLKRAGFFGKDDHRLMSKIMVNITLPCTIIQAFDGFERDAKMFIIVGIGFICAFVPILLVYLTTGRVEKRLRAYRMLNIGGYNIGCFSLPLVQAFFGNTGVVAACMFDTGNAIMMTGGAYAMTSTLLRTGGEERESVGDVLLKFVKSLPFDAYMMMIFLAALGVKIPSVVFTLTRPAGQANAFVAMLMIGMMFEPAGDRRFCVRRRVSWSGAICLQRPALRWCSSARRLSWLCGRRCASSALRRCRPLRRFTPTAATATRRWRVSRTRFPSR